MKIEGAVALVTGANGSIGKHYVETLCKAGAAKIYAGARDIETVANLVAIDPKRVIALQLNITDEQSVEDAAAQCKDVNLLINNAGIALYEGLIAAPDDSSARAEIEVNYFGTLAMCRAFAPILKRNGGGAIINMLSILARVNMPRNGGYSASKAAALSMTQGVRAELASQGTLVVAVMPGTVDTNMSKNEPPPKVSAAEVVVSALQGVINRIEEVYPGEQATAAAIQLASNPKVVEKQFAQMLPTS